MNFHFFHVPHLGLATAACFVGMLTCWNRSCKQLALLHACLSGQCWKSLVGPGHGNTRGSWTSATAVLQPGCHYRVMEPHHHCWEWPLAGSDQPWGNLHLSLTSTSAQGDPALPFRQRAFVLPNQNTHPPPHFCIQHFVPPSRGLEPLQQLKKCLDAGGGRNDKTATSIVCQRRNRRFTLPSPEGMQRDTQL